MGTPFPHFMLHACLWISLLALSLRFGNLIFHFSSLRSLPALSFHPSVSLWLNLSVFLYSPFLLWCCSEWSLWNGNEDSGALSLSQSPPLSRHQNEAMPPMFFSDLGVLPNLISGAERERWKKRVSRMQRKERSVGEKDERREDEKWTRERGNMRDEDKAWDWSKSIWAFSHIIAEPSTIPPLSAEQLLLASGSGSADKMAWCYYAKWKTGGVWGDCYRVQSRIFGT